MTYFLMKLRSVFHRIKYLSLIVMAYIFCEYKVATLSGGKGAWWQFALFYIIDVFFFYLNCYYIFPVAYKQRKTIFLPLLLVPFSLSIHYLFTITAYAWAFPTSNGFFGNVSNAILIIYVWRILIVAVLAAVPFGVHTAIQILKRQKVLENNALYSRISPHLLFNSLNFVHADVRNTSAKADKMITYLSEYSRYAMAELAEDGKANLEAELAQLNILIKINELRFGVLHLVLEINTNDPVELYRIPPHVILSLAENIFKYGVITDSQRPVTIEIFDSPKLLHIHMRNWKADLEGVISHKLGLDNLRKRLKNIYNNFFTLKIEESEDSFSVYLIIPI